MAVNRQGASGAQRAIGKPLGPTAVRPGGHKGPLGAPQAGPLRDPYGPLGNSREPHGPTGAGRPTDGPTG